MSATPISFTAERLSAALRQCLAQTATDRTLEEALEAVEAVHTEAGMLLKVAAHLEGQLEVDLNRVVLGGWAGALSSEVPDTVPAAWLDADDDKDQA